ncbi:MAG: PIG-L family deacetylase, partial [Proteobacteria bacterium]|nr:PIG-L family deacetylase [Pseudomonadota bacterium]
MKILAIGAHPDDIEAGCSGTLAKYAQNGHDIYLLIMTEGHMGGEGAIRKKEQTKSAKILKPRELIWGAYKDTLLLPHM